MFCGRLPIADCFPRFLVATTTHYDASTPDWAGKASRNLPACFELSSLMYRWFA